MEFLKGICELQNHKLISRVRLFQLIDIRSRLISLARRESIWRSSRIIPSEATIIIERRRKRGGRERLGEMYVNEERRKKRAKHSVSSKNKGRGNTGHNDNININNNDK